MLEKYKQKRKAPMTTTIRISTSTVLVVLEFAFPVQLFFAEAEFPCLEAAHASSMKLAPVQ